MNGAQSLLKILVEADIEVCFANPGTSEMHLVLESVKPILSRPPPEQDSSARHFLHACSR